MRATHAESSPQPAAIVPFAKARRRRYQEPINRTWPSLAPTKSVASMKTIRIVLWAAVVVMAGILGWLTYEMTQSKQQAASGPFGVPFTLVAQNGKEITEKAFTGKPTALFFGFTHCPEVCPTT